MNVRTIEIERWGRDVVADKHARIIASISPVRNNNAQNTSDPLLDSTLPSSIVS